MPGLGGNASAASFSQKKTSVEKAASALQPSAALRSELVLGPSRDLQSSPAPRSDEHCCRQ